MFCLKFFGIKRSFWGNWGRIGWAELASLDAGHTSSQWHTDAMFIYNRFKKWLGCVFICLLSTHKTGSSGSAVWQTWGMYAGLKGTPVITVSSCLKWMLGNVTSIVSETRRYRKCTIKQSSELERTWSSLIVGGSKWIGKCIVWCKEAVNTCRIGAECAVLGLRLVDGSTSLSAFWFLTCHALWVFFKWWIWS